jgi:glycolate oxidase FAD binding subunit
VVLNGAAEAIAAKLALVLHIERITPFEQWSQAWQAALATAYIGNAQALPMVSPQTVEELTAVVTLAHQMNWKLLVAGQGSKLGWGKAAKKIDLLVSTRNLHQLIDHAVGDMTVTAQAGRSFAQLQTCLAKHNQWIPLDPVYPDQATLGGILATRDTGSLRHRYGGVRDLCLGLSFVRCDGKIAKAGGRVVKNVAGYDLMKLFAGSFGTLGIVTELTLRTYPLPECSETVLVRGEGGAIANLTQTLMRSTLTPTAVDLCVGLEPTSTDITLALRFQSVAESVLTQVTQVHALAQALNVEGVKTQWWEDATTSLREQKGSNQVLCQVGVLPALAVSSLATMQHKAEQALVKLQGRIHARSGVGELRLTGSEADCRGLLRDLRLFLAESDG